MDFFLIWIFPALLLGGIAFFLLQTTNHHIKRCKVVSGWATTQAVIESAEVLSHATRHRPAGSRISYRRVNYEPKIEYTYKVFDEPFRSDAFQNFAGVYPDGSEDEAARIVAAYPVGKEVTIRYNPENPADAYLLPQTDSGRLVKSRMGQMVMLIIALLWITAGSTIYLARVLNEKNVEKQIHASTALLPFTTQEINANLDPLVAKYQLVCQDDSVYGHELKYHIRVCRAETGQEITSLALYDRQEAPEKADFLSAVFTPSNQETTITFFVEAAALVFSGDELTTVHDWLMGNIQQVAAGEGDVDLTLSGIDLALDNLGGTVRLNIGDLQ